MKYKKHKKSVRNGQMKGQVDKGKALISPEPTSHMPPHLVNGTILKTALTNPSEVSKFSIKETYFILHFANLCCKAVLYMTLRKLYFIIVSSNFLYFGTPVPV